VASAPGSRKRTTSKSKPAETAQESALEPQAEPAAEAAMPPKEQPASEAPRAAPGNYTVVARRYRPQRFEDVVGQDHVVQALRNAIRFNRLAQAYLFCGTRGVGKTSMARIFAKCLNCVQGPTESPCQVCDICQAIASGQDVDVIEIDGASNNGVEQVRELRQNASLRPSRSRFKIYYIDEVHMLSTGAFNALLKTLEEPPPHVKFFFATTEGNKIPITVLSRCQRYDFAGITPDAIVGTLQEICSREQVEAEPEALQVVARRAGGSMRDAQSLLEQLLASGSPKLTVEVVHALLGTPSDERLLAMLEALAEHDSAAVLTQLDQAAAQGVQSSDMLAGVLDYLRDAMVLSVGAGSVLLAVTPRQKPRLQKVVDHWPTEAILAALQILAEARARMRGVSHGRLLAEVALLRVARLEALTDLSHLVDRLAALEAGSSLPREKSAQSVKKKPVSIDLAPDREPPGTERMEPGAIVSRTRDSEASLVSAPSPVSVRTETAEPVRETAAGAEQLAEPVRPPDEAQPIAASRADLAQETVATAGHDAVSSSLQPAHRGDPAALELSRVRQIWEELVKKVGPNLGWRLTQAEAIGVEDPDVLVIAAKPGYNSVADLCGSDEAREKIELCLQRLLRRHVTVRYEQSSEEAPAAGAGSAADSRRPDRLAADPMIQKVVELFEARPLHLDYDDPTDAA
jgi:DNA polymerase-3 subunit gamma/tau